MKNSGFTLVELLAVIVILAVLALIATPVVLSIIDDTKESAMLRSAEMYLSGVENAVMRENMNSGGNFRPNECTITNGNMTCGSTNVEVEVDGEVPPSGSIVFENGKIKEVTLNYESGTIVKDSSGNLVFSDEENDSANLDMSTVSATLEENDWKTIQKVVKAGKAAEVGWQVGDTKTLEINGQTKEAAIIGLDHDGENTATFMVLDTIGTHVINSDENNAGGWKDSEMRTWLNDEVYESMSNKDQVKEVIKMTDNVGGAGETPIVSATSDRVFLLSVIEIDQQYIAEEDYGYQHMDVINREGVMYKYFESNGLPNVDSMWLRSPYSENNNKRFFYYETGNLQFCNTNYQRDVVVAFVIG